MPNYSPLSPGHYQMKRAEVLARPIYPASIASQDWFQFGDVDSFNLTITPTKIDRKRKNSPVRTKAIEVINEVDSAYTMSCYQWIPFVRAVSVLGKREALTQVAAVDQTYAVTALRTGGIYWVEALDISNVTVTASGDTPPAMTLNTHFRVVDAALGMVQIVALPEGVAEGTAGSIGFSAAEITAADKRMTARVASEIDIRVELMVREVGRHGTPSVLHLYDATISPTGDVPFISDDDFSPVEIGGSALDTANGPGVLIDLKD